MGWIRGILGILGKGLALAQSLVTAKEREKDREAGRDETKVKGYEDAANARKRIDAVERPGDNDTVDSLRKNKF